jgi:2-polyprenyl-3-methyl-5-hydroxy-6-metoxy-1,4-benzoquinol methylase
MQRWQDISSDPNAPEVGKYRLAELHAARAEPIPDRVEYIKELARGKRVLDIGVVDHQIGKQHSPGWLHGAIASVAAHTVGVDILPDAVEALKKEGYNVRLWDVTEKPLAEQFELITAGEVIEHLGSPAKLFESARQMLASGGRFVLTTPNPYYLARVRDNLRHGVGAESADHVTLLFPSGMAELSARAGLRLDRWRGIKVQPPRAMTKVFFGAARLMRFAPESRCNTLLYEFVPAQVV